MITATTRPYPGGRRRLRLAVPPCPAVKSYLKQMQDGVRRRDTTLGKPGTARGGSLGQPGVRRAAAGSTMDALHQDRRFQEALEYAESIIATVREPLLVL